MRHRMAKRISILGSTGSIGTQTLDAARNLDIDVVALTGYRNIDLLEKQVREFKPEIVSVGSREDAEILKRRIADMDVKVYYGDEGLKRAATIESADTVVAAIVGIAGLIPTLEAIKAKKNIALANKETLVTAGEIVISEARKNNVKILPVDSEHSAIYQCLGGNDVRQISKIMLTASGGPFRTYSTEELVNVTPADALKHPNWRMGPKITIDSATLMNKGLEVIEAKWLFDLRIDQIEVLVHPQSAIHSMVEFEDGSIIAQLASPDMRIPIQYALTYPERCQNNFSRLDFLKVSQLTFEKPKYDVFPCLKYAFEALEQGGTMPVVLNGANEVAVEMFLNGMIGFLDIPKIIKETMDLHENKLSPELSDILEADIWAKNEARRIGGLYANNNCTACVKSYCYCS